MHHQCNAAALKEFHNVFPPNNTTALYAALQRFLSCRPKRAFTAADVELMVPANKTTTDTSQWDITLVHKIATECLHARFVSNGKSFATPTPGLVIRNPPLQLPNLAGSNSGDHLNLMKCLRNVLAHWPNLLMKESDFQDCWKFLMSLLSLSGINCAPLADLKDGCYLSSEHFESLVCIMKEKDEKYGRFKNFVAI